MSIKLYYLIFILAVAAQLTVSAAAQTNAGKVAETAQNYSKTALLRRRVITDEVKLPSAANAFDLERAAFALLNEKRGEVGLPPLKWNDDVAKIARLHSQNMANYQFFSHAGLDGTMVNDRADRIGLHKWRAIGENIAYNRGYSNPVAYAVERWMLSNAHKQNLLGKDWRESAVGIAVAPDGTYYFTQVFLNR